ncbi:MAG: hypothetical protein OIF48_04830, partial [Silicimonas sp.]|nr:hypothetical protein [Silicimonas sp.]
GNDNVLSGGGGGDDRITGGAGDDTIVGGSGNDTASYGGSSSDFDVSYNAATGELTITDTNTADGLDEGTDLLSGIERIAFGGTEVDASSFQVSSTTAADVFDYDTGTPPSHGAMSIPGSASADTINVSGSSDVTVQGSADDDRITSSSGNDALYGGSGNDTILGGAGDDSLYGGTGSDSMVGGDGHDVFTLTAGQGADTVEGGAGWTDVLELAGFSGDFTIDGNTIDGAGWTMVLDAGDAVTASTSDTLELSADASGMITFDDGGTVDFTGIEKVLV